MNVMHLLWQEVERSAVCTAFFFFFQLLEIRVKKLKLHTLSFVYQFLSICKTQTWRQPRPFGLVNTVDVSVQLFSSWQ